MFSLTFGGLYRQKYDIVMFSHSVFHLNGTNCCSLYPKMGPVYLNTLYLHRERILSTGAAQTGQVKATTGSLSSSCTNNPHVHLLNYQMSVCLYMCNSCERKYKMQTKHLQQHFLFKILSLKWQQVSQSISTLSFFFRPGWFYQPFHPWLPLALFARKQPWRKCCPQGEFSACATFRLITRSIPPDKSNNSETVQGQEHRC